MRTKVRAQKKAEDRHLEIIKSRLKKYPYSFYAFGSRANGKPKSLSDLDICFAGDIPAYIVSQIEEDFEGSDLPYKVGILDLQKCSGEFRQAICNDLICIQANSYLLKIEKNTFKHFSYLPTLLGYEIKNIHGSHAIDFAEADSIVYGATFNDNNTDTAINEVMNLFDGRAFAWWLGPSSYPKSLNKNLAAKGFINETTEYAMIYDLNTKELPHKTSELEIKLVNDLDDFITVLSAYDKKARFFYEKLDPTKSKDEKIFVGYENNIPVTIGMVCFDDDTAGIFSLLTIPNKRCKGLWHGNVMSTYEVR